MKAHRDVRLTRKNADRVNGQTPVRRSSPGTKGDAGKDRAMHSRHQHHTSSSSSSSSLSLEEKKERLSIPNLWAGETSLCSPLPPSRQTDRADFPLTQRLWYQNKKEEAED